MKRTLTSMLALTVGVIPGMAVPQENLYSGSNEIRPPVVVPSLTTIRLETIRARDEELLRTLAAALQMRHADLLVGTKVLFTRVESYGTVFYRMDIQGIEDEENARQICEILEMERCLVARPGVSALAGAEVRGLPVGNDGLLDVASAPADFSPSMDPGVRPSGSVEMEPLATQAQGSEAWDSINKLNHLPVSRPQLDDKNLSRYRDGVDVADADADTDESGAVSETEENTVSVKVLTAGADVIRPRMRPGSEQELAAEADLETASLEGDVDAEENIETVEQERPAPESATQVVEQETMPSVEEEETAPALTAENRSQNIEKLRMIQEFLPSLVQAGEAVSETLSGEMPVMPEDEVEGEEESVRETVEESRAPASSIEEVLASPRLGAPRLDLNRSVEREVVKPASGMSIALVDPLTDSAVSGPVHDEAEMEELIVSALAEPLRPVLRGKVLVQLAQSEGTTEVAVADFASSEGVGSKAIDDAVSTVVGSRISAVNKDEPVLGELEFAQTYLRPMMRPEGFGVERQVAVVENSDESVNDESDRRIAGRAVIGARTPEAAEPKGLVRETASLGQTRQGRQAEVASKVSSETALLALSAPADAVKSSETVNRRPIAFVAPRAEAVLASVNAQSDKLMSLPLARPAREPENPRIAMVRAAAAAERARVEQARIAQAEALRQAEAEKAQSVRVSLAKPADEALVASSGKRIEVSVSESVETVQIASADLSQADSAFVKDGTLIRPRMRPGSEQVAQLKQEEAEDFIASDLEAGSVLVALDSEWASKASSELVSKTKGEHPEQVVSDKADQAVSDVASVSFVPGAAPVKDSPSLGQTIPEKANAVLASDAPLVNVESQSAREMDSDVARKADGEFAQGVLVDSAIRTEAEAAMMASVSDVAPVNNSEPALTSVVDKAVLVISERESESLEAPAFWLPSPRPQMAKFVIPEMEFPTDSSMAKQVEAFKASMVSKNIDTVVPVIRSKVLAQSVVASKRSTVSDVAMISAVSGPAERVFSSVNPSSITSAGSVGLPVASSMKAVHEAAPIVPVLRDKALIAMAHDEAPAMVVASVSSELIQEPVVDKIEPIKASHEAVRSVAVGKLMASTSSNALNAMTTAQHPIPVLAEGVLRAREDRSTSNRILAQVLPEQIESQSARDVVVGVTPEMFGDAAQVLAGRNVDPVMPMMRSRAVELAALEMQQAPVLSGAAVQRDVEAAQSVLGTALAQLSEPSNPVPQAVVAQEEPLLPILRPSTVQVAMDVPEVSAPIEQTFAFVKSNDRYRSDLLKSKDTRPVHEFLATFGVEMPLSKEELLKGQEMLALGDMTVSNTVVLLAQPQEPELAKPVEQEVSFSSNDTDPRSVLMLDEFITALATEEVNFVVPVAIDLNKFQSSPEAREMLAQANEEAVNAANEEMPETITATVTEDGVEMNTPHRRVVVPRTARPVSRFAVALNDTYALPFDLSGSGRLPLQRMPISRPDVVEGDQRVALLAAPEKIEEPTPDMARFFPENPLNAVEEIVSPSAPVVSEEEAVRDSVAQSIALLTMDEDGLLETPSPAVRPSLDGRPEAMAPVVSDGFTGTTTPVPQLDVAPVETTREAAPEVEDQTPVIGNGAYGEHELAVDGQSRSIMDRDTRRVANGPDENLMIRLSYASSIEQTSGKVQDLMRYFPQAMLDKGRFFGQAAPASPNLFVIGIQAHNANDFRDLVEYMNVNGIVHVLPGQSARALLTDPLVFNN